MLYRVAAGPHGHLGHARTAVPAPRRRVYIELNRSGSSPVSDTDWFVDADSRAVAGAIHRGAPRRDTLEAWGSIRPTSDWRGGLSACRRGHYWRASFRRLVVWLPGPEAELGRDALLVNHPEGETVDRHRQRLLDLAHERE